MALQIFLIDDDVDDRDLFREGLESVAPGIEYHSASDCSEALKKLNEKIDNLPDVIFMDINLPVISGWECYRRILQDDALKNIPVVFYSTSSHAKDKQTAKDLGAVTFISKPHNFNDLKAMLLKVTRHLTNGSLMELAEN